MVVRQHQDVAAADVDFVGTQLALHDKEVAVYVGNLGDFQARQQGFQHGFAGFGDFAQIAEGIALPVAVKTRLSAVVFPSRVVAHARHAHKQIHVAQHFGKHARRNIN